MEKTLSKKKIDQIIKKRVHPVLNHVTPDMELTDAYIKEIGVVERGGEIYQYQLIKIYLKVKDGSP